MKKIIKYTLLMFTVVLLMANSCGKLMETWYSIKVENKTSKALRVTAGCSKFMMNSYPDTTLPSNKPFLLNVSPKNYNHLDHSFPWEVIIQGLPADTLSIYIFDADTLNTYDWRSIKEGYKILKRYDLSLDDLKKSNWTITYP